MSFDVYSGILDFYRFDLVYIFNNDHIIFLSITVFIDDYDRWWFLCNYADNVLFLLPELVLEVNLNRISESQGSLILQPIRSDIDRAFVVNLCHIAISKEGDFTTFDLRKNFDRCVLTPILAKDIINRILVVVMVLPVEPLTDLCQNVLRVQLAW